MGWFGKAPLLPGECKEPAEQAQGPAARCHRGGGVPAGQLAFALHLPEACRLDTSWSGSQLRLIRDPGGPNGNQKSEKWKNYLQKNYYGCVVLEA